MLIGYLLQPPVCPSVWLSQIRVLLKQPCLGMCSVHVTSLNFWEMTDNIFETVQDRDIVIGYLWKYSTTTLCLHTNWGAYVTCNFKCCVETEELHKVANSCIHYKSCNTLEMVVEDKPLAYQIVPILVIVMVIYLFQAFLKAISTRDSIYAIAHICHGNSVCPSVCLSHGWISLKHLKLGLCSFHHTVGPSL